MKTPFPHMLAVLVLFAAGSAYAEPTDEQRKQCRDMSQQYTRELSHAKTMGANLSAEYEHNASEVSRKVRNHMLWLADRNYGVKELQTAGFSHCLAQY